MRLSRQPRALVNCVEVETRCGNSISTLPDNFQSSTKWWCIAKTWKDFRTVNSMNNLHIVDADCKISIRPLSHSVCGRQRRAGSLKDSLNGTRFVDKHYLACWIVDFYFTILTRHPSRLKIPFLWLRAARPCHFAEELKKLPKQNKSPACASKVIRVELQKGK